MSDFNEKDVIGRIIQLRNRYAGERGRSKFAAEIGISPSTYSYYEQDRLPPVDILLKICQITGTDIYWLLTGSAKNGSAANMLSTSFAERIENLARYEPASIKALEAFVQLLEEKAGIEKKQNKSEKALEVKTGLIPILGRTAAGIVGLWNDTDLANSKNMETNLEKLVEKHLDSPVVNAFEANMSADLQAREIINMVSDSNISLVQKSGNQDSEIVQFLDCQSLQQAYPDCFALQIDGDSMSPRINDGDIVVLSPSAPALQGCVAVIRVADAIGVTCKIVRKSGENMHLIPINERYETKVVPTADVLWALAVLCHVKIKS